MTAPAASGEARILRNLAIGERFFEAYHRSVERGELRGAFEPDDFAEAWVFWSPYIGGEMRLPRESFLKQGAAANHARISQRIPDYRMDDFRAWPTERGVAWRWRVNGTGIDGRRYEFWEQNFIWTDDDGKIIRFEFFDDWHGFPQTLAFAYDQSLDEVTRIQGYGRAPWTPAPSAPLGVPPGPPRRDPPAGARVAHNLDIARRAFAARRRPGAGSGLDPADFAADWTLFSPWSGEVRGIAAHDALTGFDLLSALGPLSGAGTDDLEAWPTDWGCAWRWRTHGRSAGGVGYEIWEQVFVDTDADGKILRMERFADWQGLPQALGFVTGLELDALWDARTYRARAAD